MNQLCADSWKRLNVLVTNLITSKYRSCIGDLRWSFCRRLEEVIRGSNQHSSNFIKQFTKMIVNTTLNFKTSEYWSPWKSWMTTDVIWSCVIRPVTYLLRSVTYSTKPISVTDLRSYKKRSDIFLIFPVKRYFSNILYTSLIDSNTKYVGLSWQVLT